MASNMNGESIPDCISMLRNSQVKMRRAGLTRIREIVIEPSYIFNEADDNMLREGFRVIFVDKQTMIYEEFLHTIEVLLKTFRQHMYKWSNIIVSKFLHKLGLDPMSDSITQRLKNILVFLPNYIDAGVVLHSVFRLLSDSSQPMTDKTLILTYQYIGDFGRRPESSNEHFYYHKDYIIPFSNLAGHCRRASNNKFFSAASHALTGLFNTNSQTFYYLHNNLSKDRRSYLDEVINEYVTIPDDSVPKRLFSGTPFEFVSPSPSVDLLDSSIQLKFLQNSIDTSIERPNSDFGPRRPNSTDNNLESTSSLIPYPKPKSGTLSRPKRIPACTPKLSNQSAELNGHNEVADTFIPVKTCLIKSKSIGSSLSKSNANSLKPKSKTSIPTAPSPSSQRPTQL